MIQGRKSDKKYYNILSILIWCGWEFPLEWNEVCKGLIYRLGINICWKQKRKHSTDNRRVGNRKVNGKQLEELKMVTRSVRLRDVIFLFGSFSERVAHCFISLLRCFVCVSLCYSNLLVFLSISINFAIVLFFSSKNYNFFSSVLFSTFTFFSSFISFNWCCYYITP